MQLAELERLALTFRTLLEFVETDKVLGRVQPTTGRVERLGGPEIRGIIGLPTETAFNAIKDTDDSALYDLDGQAIYEPGDWLDNPIAPTRFFDTVDDMLAADGVTIDRAVTMNYSAGDGLRQDWVMMADPTLSDNASNIRETADGYGFMSRIGQIT